MQIQSNLYAQPHADTLEYIASILLEGVSIALVKFFLVGGAVGQLEIHDI